MLDALLRENVTLVTDGIGRINATGIEAGDGTQHDVDIIVYATGFRAADFLYPMTITGARRARRSRSCGRPTARAPIWAA